MDPISLLAAFVTAFGIMSADAVLHSDSVSVNLYMSDDLSKGTAQKVGLAQALLIRPGLLVLDEPWEGLDSVARELIPAIVGEVTAAGGAVLVSDHRGEIAHLPGAIRWSVARGTVRPGDDSRADEVIVEVAVRRAEADVTMARLRAEGHQVLGVRAETPR